LLSAIWTIRTCGRFGPNTVRHRSHKATARRASEASHPARPTNVKRRPKGAFLLSAIPASIGSFTQVLLFPADISSLGRGN